MQTDPISVLDPVSVIDAVREIPATGWMVEPFLHVDGDRAENPITDRTIKSGEPGWEVLKGLLAGPARVAEVVEPELRALADEGWLVPARPDLDRRHRLKFVSLETHTVCNQKCYFCPVSIKPRDSHFMPTELFERIVGELGAYRETLEGVFIITYNEPTVDPRFVDQCRSILGAGLPLSVNTNGSGLTPKRIDEVMEAGRLRFLLINLSTLDPEEYQRTRGVGHLDRVIANVEYANRHRIAEEMVILVLGEDDENHDRNFQAISEHFAGGTFNVQRYAIMDRAGNIGVGIKPGEPHGCLRGCENLGSRPLQHLHITPHGRCILCCEDYDENNVVGDLRSSSVTEVLEGAGLAKMRRWIYGLEEAPADFICRGCIYART